MSKDAPLQDRLDEGNGARRPGVEFQRAQVAADLFEDEGRHQTIFLQSKLVIIDQVGGTKGGAIT